MPRIRRGGKRIRGSNGGRTRNENCCCTDPPDNCTELLAYLQTVELEFEILTGASYPNACCSGVTPVIAAYLTTVVGTVVHDLVSAVPGCAGAGNMKWQSRIQCSVTNASIEVDIYKSDLSATWGSWFSGGFNVPLTSFFDGNTIDVPWDATAVVAGYCEVSGSPFVRVTIHE